MVSPEAIVSSADSVSKIGELLKLTKELTELLARKIAERAAPIPKWFEWILLPRQRVILVAVTLVLVFSVARFFWLPFVDLEGSCKALLSNRKNVEAICISGNIKNLILYTFELVIIILAGLYVAGKSARETASELSNEVLARGERAEEQFLSWWRLLWLSWFVLYLFLAVGTLKIINTETGPALTNLANNFSGLFLLLMFYEASEKTASDSSSSMSGHAWMPMLMLLALLFVGQWAIAEIGTSESLRIPFVFELISGVITGVFTGLLVSRLTSRIFSLHVSTLVVLTTYAVVQPMFPLLGDPKDDVDRGIAFVVAMFAIYSKVILLISVEWMRDVDRVLWYMIRIRYVYEEEAEKKVGQVFPQFLETLHQLTPEERRLTSAHGLGVVHQIRRSEGL